jgi:hypothetical protein
LDTYANWRDADLILLAALAGAVNRLEALERDHNGPVGAIHREARLVLKLRAALGIVGQP